MQRVTLVTVVGLAALSECRVLARAGMDVEFLYRLFQARRIDAGPVSEFV